MPDALPRSEDEVFALLTTDPVPAVFTGARFAWVELAEGDEEPLRVLDGLDADGEPLEPLYVVAEADSVPALVEAALGWVDDAVTDDLRDEAVDVDPDERAPRLAGATTTAARRLFDRLYACGIFDFDAAEAVDVDHASLAPLAAFAGEMTPLFGFSAAAPYHDDAFAVVRLLPS